MSEPSSTAPSRPLLRLHDGGIAGGATSVALEHVYTLRTMMGMLTQIDGFANEAVQGTLHLLGGVLRGEAPLLDLRGAASWRARAQADHEATREESDALLCALLAVKVALVLVGDRMERTHEIREEFARALAGCGVQMLWPQEDDEPISWRATS